VATVLDFRALPGEWRFDAPGIAAPVVINCRPGEVLRGPDVQGGQWFALIGPRQMVVQQLRRGASLAAVRQRVTFVADPTLSAPPEAEPGQCPGVGFVLEGWDGVEGGLHLLEAVSYAVAADTDLSLFLATVAAPLEARVAPVQFGTSPRPHK
jgi:hypothetical protein